MKNKADDIDLSGNIVLGIGTGIALIKVTTGLVENSLSAQTLIISSVALITGIVTKVCLSKGKKGKAYVK